MYFIFTGCFKQRMFLRMFLKGLLESGMVFDKLGPTFIKKLLKAFSISIGFVISLSFTLTMFGWILLLDFNVISYRIPFDIKVVLLRFLSKNNLKYSFLDLHIEKVTLFLNFSNSSWINFFLSLILAGTIFSEQFISFPHKMFDFFIYPWFWLQSSFFFGDFS